MTKDGGKKMSVALQIGSMFIKPNYMIYHCQICYQLVHAIRSEVQRKTIYNHINHEIAIPDELAFTEDSFDLQAWLGAMHDYIAQEGSQEG